PGSLNCPVFRTVSTWPKRSPARPGDCTAPPPRTAPWTRRSGSRWNSCPAPSTRGSAPSSGRTGAAPSPGPTRSCGWPRNRRTPARARPRAQAQVRPSRTGTASGTPRRPASPTAPSTRPGPPWPAWACGPRCPSGCEPTAAGSPCSPSTPASRTPSTTAPGDWAGCSPPTWASPSNRPPCGNSSPRPCAPGTSSVRPPASSWNAWAWTRPLPSTAWCAPRSGRTPSCATWPAASSTRTAPPTAAAADRPEGVNGRRRDIRTVMTFETPDTLDHAMARSSGLDTLLRDLTDRAVQEVPGASACSITVRRADRLLTLAGSDGLPSGLDQRQYENGSGPCVAAADTGREQYSPDLTVEARWPGYTRYALSEGVRSVLAVPLEVTDGRGAALNLYAEQPG